jgi:uncharacterized oxidoreductase
MRMQNNTILITGGSAGIGLATAKAFVATGNTVIVCGRDQLRLQKAKETVPGIHTIQCDIARDDELAGLLQQVQSDFPRLNMLVNNAAMMCRYNLGGSFEEGERIEGEVRTNLLAPMKLTSQVLPVLQQQTTAAIIFISSGLAYVPVANLAVYCATKAALHSFARSLRAQLKKTSIKVFELLPPPVDTDLAREWRMPKIPAEKVARALLKGLEREHYEIRVGMVKPLTMASHLIPSLMERMLNKAFSY